MLTGRDVEFLNDLYKVKYLNTKRIEKLYGNYKVAMRRLKILEQEKYVKVIDNIYNRENVYCVGKRIFDKFSLPYITINKTDKLLHYLACADFYFYIKNYNPISVEYEKQFAFKNDGKKYSFRPDLIVDMQKKYFIEIDLCSRRFEPKVQAWEMFYISGESRKYFEKFPIILIVTEHPEKIQNIINSCKKIDLPYAFKKLDEVQNWQYKYVVR